MTPKSAERMLRRFDSAFRVLRGLQPKAVRRLRKGRSCPGWLREPFLMIWRRSRSGEMQHVRTIQDALGHARPIEEADVQNVLFCAHHWDKVLKGKSAKELHEHGWHEVERMIGDDHEEQQEQRSLSMSEARKKHFRDRMRFAMKRDRHQVVRGTEAAARRAK